MFTMINPIITNFYTIGREYRVMRKRYSRLLFTSEDRFYVNLRVQEQSTKRRHNASISRSRDVTDQLWWRHNAKLDWLIEHLYFVIPDKVR